MITGRRLVDSQLAVHCPYDVEPWDFGPNKSEHSIVGGRDLPRDADDRAVAAFLSARLQEATQDKR